MKRLSGNLCYSTDQCVCRIRCVAVIGGLDHGCSRCVVNENIHHEKFVRSAAWQCVFQNVAFHRTAKNMDENSVRVDASVKLAM